jgi:hypothetical protein
MLSFRCRLSETPGIVMKVTNFRCTHERFNLHLMILNFLRYVCVAEVERGDFGNTAGCAIKSLPLTPDNYLRSWNFLTTRILQKVYILPVNVNFMNYISSFQNFMKDVLQWNDRLQERLDFCEEAQPSPKIQRRVENSVNNKWISKEMKVTKSALNREIWNIKENKREKRGEWGG